MKQGTGLPQLFGLLIVFGVGIAFMTIIFFFSGPESALAEVAKEDFLNAQAHYTLNGFLRTPITIQEDTQYEWLQTIRVTTAQPTMADVLAEYNPATGLFRHFQSEDLQVQQQISNISRSFLGRELQFMLSLDDTPISWWPGSLDGWTCREPGDNTAQSGVAQAVIPSSDEERVVTLELCGVQP